MELNITKFFREAAPMDYSASVVEIGTNAGPDTWRAACDDSSDYMMLDTDDKRDAFRTDVAEYGAWTAEEIAAWTDIELNALLLQMIAGDIREAGLDTENPDWAQYVRDSNAGRVRGNIFPAHGEVYYYIGG